MSENPDNQPKLLTVEELGKLKITSDEAQLLKQLNKFVGEKKKARKSKPSASAKKKSELATRLGRTVNGIDTTKTKTLALPVEAQSEQAVKNRKELRSAMASLSQEEKFEYKTVLKVFKAAGTVLADLPPPPKPEKKAKAEAPTPSTQ